MFMLILAMGRTCTKQTLELTNLKDSQDLSHRVAAFFHKTVFPFFLTTPSRLLQQFQEIRRGLSCKFIGQFQQGPPQGVDHLHPSSADIAIAPSHDVDREVQQSQKKGFQLPHQWGKHRDTSLENWKRTKSWEMWNTLGWFRLNIFRGSFDCQLGLILHNLHAGHGSSDSQHPMQRLYVSVRLVFSALLMGKGRAFHGVIQGYHQVVLIPGDRIPT